ncbi:hypothetical protein [Paenibacillus sp. GSMTC-2017]|nr:hypothetical protein [Paenibacillus sp. GSMTC-2017]
MQFRVLKRDGVRLRGDLSDSNFLFKLLHLLIVLTDDYETV